MRHRHQPPWSKERQTETKTISGPKEAATHLQGDVVKVAHLHQAVAVDLLQVVHGEQLVCGREKREREKEGWL